MANQVEINALHQLYDSLNELIGTEAMLKIYEQYRGMQISFPVHLYNRQLAATAVLAEYDGSNQQELARKYGYSQKWVQQVIRRSRDQ